MKIDSLWITAVLFFSLQAVLGNVYGLEIVAPDKFTKNAVIRLDGIEPYFGEDRLADLPWISLFDGTADCTENWYHLRMTTVRDVVIQDGMLTPTDMPYRLYDVFGSGEFQFRIKNKDFFIILWGWNDPWMSQTTYEYRLKMESGKISVTSCRAGREIPLRFYDATGCDTLFFDILAYRPKKEKHRPRFTMRVRIKLNGEVLCEFEDEFLPFGRVDLVKGTLEMMRFRGTSSYNIERHLLPEEVQKQLNIHRLVLNHDLPYGW